MEKLVYMLALVGVAFVVGLLGQNRGTKWQKPASTISTRLALTICVPLAMLGAMWQMPSVDGQLLFLPIVGAVILFTGALIGLALAKFDKLKPEVKGALVPVATFYNIGALGGLCVFALFGENGLALLGLYKLFEEVIYFSWALPYARANSPIEQKKVKKFTLPNPFTFFTLLGLITGFILNVYQVPRPEGFINLSNILVPAGSLLLVFSLGLSIELRPNMAWRSLAIRLSVLRTLISPVVGVCVMLLLGFNFEEHALVFQVVAVLAMMPAGFISLIPPVLYGVDRHVASTAWIFSMLVFIVTFCCLLIVKMFLY